jgi:catechol 2,3-dioxygenase-like lactoylglutathione lyase family enzyme
MIDHVGLPVSDYARSKEFYSAALAPLGFELAMEFGGHAAGFAREGKPWFWIHQAESAVTGVHVALRATDTATVDAFHEAALAAGGEDNGPPGIREHYHPTYYAAFVHDPDGNNVEAVNHGPAAEA